MKKIYERKGMKWLNEYFDNGEYIIIKISKSETNENYEVLIDYEDLERVKQGKWWIAKQRQNDKWETTYSAMWSKTVNGKQSNFTIYQWILEIKGYKNIVVDHINGNRLDNRRKNLRLVSYKENSRNRKTKGYNYDKQTGKYLTRISFYDGKSINIGRYVTELEAETIYLKAFILLGYFSTYHQERIEELGIELTEKDKENKYIKKIINLIEDYNSKIN